MFNKANLFKLLGALIGFVSGYAYWFFIGCEDGCTIQSVWWRMSLWGTAMGFLSSSIIIDYFVKKEEIKD